MADFTFKLFSEIILGNQSLATLARDASKIGTSFMFVFDASLRDEGISEKIIKALEDGGLSVICFDGVDHSTESEIIEYALSLAKGAHVHGIIASGGMNTVAVGRAIAALYNEKKSIYEYIEGLPCTEEPLPFIQIPTTCRNPFMFANITPIIDSRNKKIEMLNLSRQVCTLAIFDPSVYMGSSPNQKIAKTLQGVGMAFEGFISTKTNFFSETVLGKAIEQFLISLDPLYEKKGVAFGENLVMQAACLTSIGISSSSPGLGTAISLACAGRYKIASSLVATILLPYILKNAITSNLEKVLIVGRMLNVSRRGLDSVEVAEETVEEVRRILAQANLPIRLKDIGLSIEQFIPVSEDTVSLSFMNYIPKPMTSDDVFEFIKQAY